MELVGGDPQRVPARNAALDEAAHRLVEAARQPDEGLVVLDLVGRTIAEAPDIFLRCGDASVEVDVMGAAFRPFGGHDELHGSERHEIGRAALQRADRIRVGPSRLGRIVGPLEALNRLLVGRVLSAGREAGIGLEKAFHALEIAGDVSGLVDAMDREAEEARAIRLPQVDAEGDDIGPGDGVDLEPTARLAHAHRQPPPVSIADVAVPPGRPAKKREIAMARAPATVRVGRAFRDFPPS